MILWYIALVAPLIASLGLIMLRKSLPRMRGDFKTGMNYLLVSASLAVLSGIIAIVLFLLRIDITSYYWSTVPVIYFASNIFFMLNIRKIEKVFKILTFNARKGSVELE